MDPTRKKTDLYELRFSFEEEGEQNIEKHRKTKEEWLEWWKEEAEFWKPITNSYSYRNTLGELRRHFESLDRCFKKLQDTADLEEQKELFDIIQEHLCFYQHRWMLDPHSIERIWLDKHRQDQQEWEWILEYFLGDEELWKTKLLFETYDVVEGPKRWLEVEKEYLENLKSEFGRILQESNSHVREQKQQMQEQKQRLEDLENLYREQMSLLAPVEYWRRKRAKHKWAYTILGLFILLTGMAFFSFLPSLFQRYLHSPQVQWHQIIPLLVYLFLGIWLLRILVRMFLSNLHLANDAGEREVMIQTYLAMLQEDKNIQETERKNLLAAIFRPASVGIVKEDSIPPVHWSILLERWK